jgi:hypothetical protein
VAEPGAGGGYKAEPGAAGAYMAEPGAGGGNVTGPGCGMCLRCWSWIRGAAVWWKQMRLCGGAYGADTDAYEKKAD